MSRMNCRSSASASTISSGSVSGALKRFSRDWSRSLAPDDCDTTFGRFSSTSSSKSATGSMPLSRAAALNRSSISGRGWITTVISGNTFEEIRRIHDTVCSLHLSRIDQRRSAAGHRLRSYITTIPQARNRPERQGRTGRFTLRRLTTRPKPPLGSPPHRGCRALLVLLLPAPVA